MKEFTSKVSKTPRPSKSGKEDKTAALAAKQDALKKAVLAFSEDPTLKKMVQDYRTHAAAAMAELAPHVSETMPRGTKTMKYNVSRMGDAIDYFGFDEPAIFFARVAEEYSKPIKDCTTEEVEKSAKEYFEKFELGDVLTRLARQGLLSPQMAREVTSGLENVLPETNNSTARRKTTIMSVVGAPPSTEVRKYFWVNLEESVNKALGIQPPEKEGEEKKPTGKVTASTLDKESDAGKLLLAIKDAAEKTGLFDALKALEKKKRSK